VTLPTSHGAWYSSGISAVVPSSTKGLKLTGVEKFPVLESPGKLIQPERLEVFTNWKSASLHPGVVLHFYVNDPKMQYVVQNPLKWAYRLSRATAVISPDLSVRANDPQCVRRFNTRECRIAAARWQEHGINIIPNVRWNDRSDYEYCFDGLPANSQVAVSSVTMLRRIADRRNFVHGFQEMISRIHPASVIWHGRIPSEIPRESLDSTQIIEFPSRIDQVHSKGISHGRR
jgi:hypothetical protein